MKITSAAKVGLTVIILAIVLVSIYRGLGWRNPFSGPAIGKTIIYVSFGSVKGLALGADVQLNGNPIGEVDAITNDGFGGVRVSLLLDADQPIHEHAKFLISRDSIFGGYMVMIDEPRSGYMTTGIVNSEFKVRVESGMVNEGALVIKNGMPIGQIIAVDPQDARTEQAIIRLAEDIELNDMMAFVPAHPSAGGQAGLIVYDRLGPEAVVEGVREPGAEDLVADADLALQQITEQVTAIMEQLGGLLDNVEELLGPEDIRNLVNDLGTEAKLIAENIVRLTDRLNIILAETQPHLTGTLENIEGITSDAEILMAEISEYNNPEMKQNINDIIANLAEASDSLVEILDDIEVYTSDEELRGNVTGTIRETRSTVEEVRATLRNAESAMDEIASGMDVFSGVETGAEFRLRMAPDPDRWSGDLNFLLGLEQSDVFITAGIEDIGEGDLTNAQVGWWVNDEVAARAGVHRGKLGVGADWRSDAFRIMNDAYDLNEFQWDIYAGYAIIPELDLIIGLEDVLDENEVNLGLAFRF